MNEPISIMHFNFNQFEKCFKIFEENYDIYADEMRLVISIHPFTSGYWIEPNNDKRNGDNDYTYVGKKAFSLIKRVRKEYEISKKLKKYMKFIN